MASVLVEVKEFVEPAGNLSLVFMARGTNEEGREFAGGGGEGSKVKNDVPSLYGIYLPSSLSDSFGRGPNSVPFVS